MLPGRLIRPRALAVVLAAALTPTLTTLGVAPAYAAAADPRPAATGAGWLVGQLGSAPGRADYYLSSRDGSLDAAFALDAVGGHEEQVQAVADDLDAQGDFYFREQTGRPHLYAGRVARVVHLAQLAGRDTTDFAGRDVAALLESTVAPSGRIQDEFGPRDADFADTAGQAYAALALAAPGGGSQQTATATLTYLLAQQCTGGGFSPTLPTAGAAGAAGQACDGGRPDAGVTALVALLLADPALAGGPGVDAARQGALAWLERAQSADGSFSGTPDLSYVHLAAYPNAGTTGLAAWALGEADRAGPAQRAAAWVRTRQADDPDRCRSLVADQSGVVAPDADALADARTQGLGSRDVGRLAAFFRSTAYAVPGLRFAPAAASAPVPTGSGAAFRRAGTRETVAAGFAPGRTVCVVGPDGPALGVATGSSGTGPASVEVTLPRRTGTASYALSTTSGTVGTSTYRVLAATTPRVRYEKRPVRGGKQRVAVRGLAAGEHVTVTSGGVRRARGTADAQGRFRTTFAVPRAGRTGLLVRGEFPDRRASRTFVVVPRR